MRKIIVIISILIMISTGSVYASEGNFSDIDTKFTFYEEINELYQQDLITGYSDGTFRPENVVTKMEYIKMVLDSIGYKEQGSTKGYWGENYIKISEVIGFIEKGEYKQDILNEDLKREELFKLTEKALLFIGDEVKKEELYNYYIKNNYYNSSFFENSKEEFINEINVITFDDFTRLNNLNVIEASIIESISPLYLKGIINDIFQETQNEHPESIITKNSITRAEASAIIVRLINKDYRIKSFNHGGEEDV